MDFSSCGELLWLGVTAHPNAEWLARQLTEAGGWDEPPCYLIRDRAGAYGAAFIRRILAMGIRDPTGLGAVESTSRCGRTTPVRRDVCRTGRVRSSPILGGLHHQYVRV
jgi:hypothetical protein